mmetsp:Transcript_19766/g.21487  ORF Transcript_19766/g.21487 Transcript_19766/m.21487 type:complete len:358 (+) Transcript_19766:67-1140(+)
MFQLLGKVFHYWNDCEEVVVKKALPKVKKVNSAELRALKGTIIKSDMYLPFYERSSPYKVFQLPTTENQKLYFIQDSKMIHDLIALETVEENIHTIRKQRHLFNQSFLDRNPVSNSAMNASNYAKEQHKLFVSLAMGIESQIAQISIPSIFTPKIDDKSLIRFVIASTAQCYLPMLLNIESSRVPLILDDLIELLDLLEAATGKHNITFGDYLNDGSCDYDDMYERQYIPLFYKIIRTLREGESRDLHVTDLDNCSLEIINLLNASECNILKVLFTQFDRLTDARIIVNNILSWLDNMLNVVHTIVNFLVIVAHETSLHQNPKDLLTREYYQENLSRKSLSHDVYETCYQRFRCHCQ